MTSMGCYQTHETDKTALFSRIYPRVATSSRIRIRTANTGSSASQTSHWFIVTLLHTNCLTLPRAGNSVFSPLVSKHPVSHMPGSCIFSPKRHAFGTTSCARWKFSIFGIMSDSRC